MFEGTIFRKSRDFAEGGANAGRVLSGRTHRLTSAFCVARAGRALVVGRDAPMYECDAIDSGRFPRSRPRGPGVLTSVGAYQGEGLTLWAEMDYLGRALAGSPDSRISADGRI